jgi:DNA-binding transcriptional LysR family regulator
MNRLNSMRIFVAVVEGQGFSTASRALGIPLPTVSRHIAELEEHLGAQLFIRSTRKVTVTDSGRQYYENVCRILESLSDAEAQVAGEYRKPSGLLTVTTPALFGRLHVLPLLQEFMALYPDIRARLLLSNFVIDLMEEHIDLGVRIGQVTDPSLITVRLGTLSQLFCASPGYLRACGRPLVPQDLLQHQCINLSKSANPLPWSYRSPGKPLQSINVMAQLAVNFADAAIDAAISDGGIVWVYAYQAASQIAAGLLQVILTEFEADPLPVSIVYPAGRLVPQKVRYFLDFAIERLRVALVEIENQCRTPMS